MKLRTNCFTLLGILIFLAGFAGISAQTLERGAVRGTVYDPSKAPIPGAKLTLTSVSTGIKREQTSSDVGSYAFDGIAPGQYTLHVEAPSFASYTITDLTVNVGASLSLDVPMQVKTAVQTVEVSAAAVGVIDTTTAGVSQLMDERNLEHLPLEGRDYRDLAQLSPSAQVVPGLRGGIRLGGQQSDYSGLVIDGGDSTNNYFGENFGSLETKNLTVPLEAVQEFQVVTNGFAPEFGRATGGLLNVVTKSGTNNVHGEAHEYYRGGSLTANDALGLASNIDNQNQVGGSIGFPIRKDRQFLFLSAAIQRENGPLITVFCPPNSPSYCQDFLNSAGPTIGPVASGSTDTLPVACGASSAGQPVLPVCYGVKNFAALNGPHNQYQNFFTLLGHYDWQINNANHFSVRGLGTRNHTNGFTGGQGQTETPYSIGTAENFINQGIGGIFALTTVSGRAVNEVRLQISGETRKRHAIDNGAPQVLILENGMSFGQRFYLPANNDAGKLEASDNYSYSFAKHDLKFGGDVNIFTDRKDVFAGWSAGEYEYNTLCDFDPGPVSTHPWCGNYTANTGNPIPAASNPFEFIQGFGLNNVNVFKANTLKNNYNTDLGLYLQDKWQITSRLTLIYGLRYDFSWYPQPQSTISGQTVWVGHGYPGAPGSTSHQVPVPQNVPSDFRQYGPRVGLAWNLGSSAHPTIVRGAWGYYYAQTPLIFFPTIGTSLQTTVFCPAGVPFCSLPASGYPYLFPSSVSYGANELCTQNPGCPTANYVDPSFENPRVSNLTAGVEHDFGGGFSASVTYAFVHSTHLRTGGFSTTQWYRNFTPLGQDQFGRTLLSGGPGFASPLDPTLFAAQELASFGHGNYHEVVAAVNKRFSRRYQFFASYTWSRNRANASSERDTETFYGPQDPFNLNLDYGRDGLDITHQFKGGAVVDLPWGFNWSTNFILHSGLAYPAYSSVDLNGDLVVNQFAQNDRPVVQIGSGKPFLLPEYPGRQPAFYNWDMRIAKDFRFHERYGLRLSADLFNITNSSNLYSNPDVNGFVTQTNCVPVNAALYSNVTCDPLTRLPQPGDPTPLGTKYRNLDQLAPGASAFAAQFGLRFQF